jgi:DNA replication protein DnaC
MKPEQLLSQLDYLKLSFFRDNCEQIATTAAQKNWSHLHYVQALVDGEAKLRRDRSCQRKIKNAKFPLLKTIDSFDWSWPTEINRMQIQNILRLQFIEQAANVILLGGVGLGKTHLSIAIGHAACLKGFSVLFANAIDVVNSLTVAHKAGYLPREIRKYTKPQLLILDELGYLPIDKLGADLLFQVISHRYENGSILITSNRTYKNWPEVFNNDSTLTSALLDRLLHHAHTIAIAGNSFRMKEKSQN